MQRRCAKRAWAGGVEVGRGGWQGRGGAAHGRCAGVHTVLQACPAPPRLPAARLVLVAPDEWANGTVRVKDLASRQERDVPVEELV